MRHKGALILPLTAVVLALAGCSGTGAEVSHFDRDQEPTDVVSESVLTNLDDVEPDSTRFLTEDDSISFYAAKTGNSQAPCLLAVPEEETEASVGCGDDSYVSMQFGDTLYALGDRPNADAQELNDQFWKD